MPKNPLIPHPPFRWVGTQDIIQGKARWRISAQSTGLDIVYYGPYATLLSQAPLVGQPVVGYTNGGMRVESIDINELDASAGEMIVHLGAPQEGEVSTAPLGDPIYETEFCELDKPLEEHANCGTLKPDRKPLKEGRLKTWEDWAILEDGDYDDSGSEVWDLATYKAIREAGVETFSVAYPVCRRTMIYFRRPSGVGTNVYKRAHPPTASDAPNDVSGIDLEWLMTGDRITKQGRLYTRVTEWTGAWEWLELIYPH